MDSALQFSSLFPLIAAINAAVLGATVLCRSVSRVGSVQMFAGFTLLLVAAVVATILADHAGYALTFLDLRLIESILTLAAGPLVLGLVLALHSRRISLAILFGPAAAYFGAVGLLFGFDHPLALVPAVVTVQLVYSLVAWCVYGVLGRGRNPSKANDIAFWILVAVSVVHAAQISRTVGLSIPGTENSVPIVIGGLLLILTVMVVWSGWAPVLSVVQGKRKGAEQIHAAVILDLEKLMERRQIHLDPGLRLTDVAQALSVAPKVVSSAVNATMGENFSRYVGRKRIAHARNLLSSAGERRTSIEAIALMSGYRSRSAFYRAFRAETGTSPADYRTSAAMDRKSCPDS